MSMNSYIELQSRAVDLIERIKAAGISIHSSSRLPKYVSQLNAICETTETHSSPKIDHDIWIRMVSEVEDIDFIEKAMSESPEVPRWKSHMRDIVSGGTVRADETNHSRARDIQFQVFIAAMLRRAGYEISLDEPDIVATTGEQTFSVAAKRPRKIGKLSHNLRAAAKQISGARIPGLIALDLSCLIAPNDSHVIAGDAVSATDLVTEQVDNFVDRNRGRLNASVRSDDAFGLLAHLLMPVDILGGGRGFSRRITITPLGKVTRERYLLLEDMSRRLGIFQRAR